MRREGSNGQQRGAQAELKAGEGTGTECQGRTAKDHGADKCWTRRSIQIMKGIVCPTREVVLYYIDTGELKKFLNV